MYNQIDPDDAAEDRICELVARFAALRQPETPLAPDVRMEYDVLSGALSRLRDLLNRQEPTMGKHQNKLIEFLDEGE